jgi:hypothetical protein
MDQILPPYTLPFPESIQTFLTTPGPPNPTNIRAKATSLAETANDPNNVNLLKGLHPFLLQQLTNPDPAINPIHNTINSAATIPPTPAILSEEQLRHPRTTRAAILANIQLTSLELPPRYARFTKPKLIEAYLAAASWAPSRPTTPTSKWLDTCKKCEDSVITCTCYYP